MRLFTSIRVVVPVLRGGLALPDRDPYKALSLFGNDKETKPADAAPSNESSGEES